MNVNTAMRTDWPWPCEACEEAEQALQDRKAKQERLARRQASAGIPAHHHGSTLKDLASRGWDPALIFACNEWLRFGGLLYIYGSNGIGKTSAAGAAAWELALDRDVRWARAQTIARWATADFGSPERAEANKLAGQRGALVLDDLGQEQQWPQAATVIRDVLDERIDAGAPVLITSNFKVSELASRPLYGDWLGSRLALFRQLHVGGDDHRLTAHPFIPELPV